MSTQRTGNLGLPYPQVGDRSWDQPLVAALVQLDAASTIGSFAVIPLTVDGSLAPIGLDVRVAAGVIRQADGTYLAVAATTSYSVAPSTTTYLWLDNSGTLQSGTAWPTTDHIRLASVVAGTTNIILITDTRCCLGPPGGSGATTVTGSRGSNAALASLLTALAIKGIITDSTT